jgi:2-polyprenyl-3-methyl-5-hydroxy-6-metoxy-1,4-benzoquinol methylase
MPVSGNDEAGGHPQGPPPETRRVKVSHDDKAVADVNAQFAFGENWTRYSTRISDTEIEEAIAGLRKLLAGRSLKGCRFLDIGCGSGLHSVAAMRLGASEVLAVDVDPLSVETTKETLGRFAPDSRYRVEQTSVFDLEPAALGRFEVVYSWGVLHHTGNLRLALRKAAGIVETGGDFLFALYRRTWMCPFWRLEKKWYSKASEGAQSFARAVYLAFFVPRLWVAGRSFNHHVRSYRKTRGMDYFHDLHDWLGGYPYESISSEEVDGLMGSLGLVRRLSFVQKGIISRLGIFGSGCDEYVYGKE